jgi:hypothetical protein
MPVTVIPVLDWSLPALFFCLTVMSTGHGYTNFLKLKLSDKYIYALVGFDFSLIKINRLKVDTRGICS